MAKVIHTIKGRKYAYEHTRHGHKVDCVRCKDDAPDGRRTTNMTTRLSNANRTKDIVGRTIYATQQDLDGEVRNAYTRVKVGIKRIQTEIFGQIGLSPSRREVENYLQDDLGITLRKRAVAVPAPNDTTKSDLAQAKTDLVAGRIDRDSKEQRIEQMQQMSIDDAKKILLLKEKLMNYRDMGRAPTDSEIEELIG